MRTASEILLSIEEKINLLVGYAKNLDNNVKIILSKMNEAEVAPAKPEKKPKASPKRTTVNQLVLFGDGKPIPMANVEINNASGFLEKATRTNNNGRWMAALPPGTYNVFIAKKGDKFPIEIRTVIEVPDEAGNIELSNAVLKA